MLNYKMGDWDSDKIVEQWLHDNDGTTMPLPNIESEPHLLISKVRKHYLEYLLKLLTINYESNQKLMNKNIYLPSAIWRCAKLLEMSAAKSSMVIHLYRQNVIAVIKDLKTNTQNGKLYKKLYDCLKSPPENEKRTQTRNFKDCNCKCTCNLKKKFKTSKIAPVIEPNLIVSDKNDLKSNIPDVVKPSENVSKITEQASPNICVSVDIDMKNSDDLMRQLEQLFQSENDDDIFDNTLFNIDNDINNEENQNDSRKPEIIGNPPTNTNDPIVQMQSKPLDERLALLSGILVSNIEPNTKQVKEDIKSQRHRTSKWMCEEYFLKAKLFELLDELRDSNRSKLIKIKNKMLDLFGCDSDDEGVISPIEETSDFITSCKERITPWVVKILTPYYVKGKIRGKAVFKALAKHLIQLIYQCSKYPYEYEVESFVKDFLESHTMIRSEADFQQFRIENI